MRVYKTEEAFLTDVQQSIAAEQLPLDEIAGPLNLALQQGVQEAERETLGGDAAADGLNLQVGNWVIRDKDLPVLEAIGMVGAAITAVMAPGALAAGAVVAGLTSFAKLAWSTWRKSARLSQGEIAVIAFLQMEGPLSLEDLLARAAEVLPDLSADEVKSALLSLTDVEQLDGDIVELVRKDASGRWRVRDL